MKLTVLLCVHNGMPFLPEAVESILNQSYKDYQFFIIDNASTDSTTDYLNSLKDERVIVRYFSNKNIIEVHNFGLSQISTEYTAIMDADDFSHSDRLRAQIRFLEANPEVGLVGTAISYVGTSNRKWDLIFPSTHEEIIYDMLKGHHVISHPSIMFRTAVALKIGGYNKNSFPVPDLDFFFRFSQESKLCNLSGIYHFYRISGNSFTQNHLKDILFSKNILINRFKKQVKKSNNSLSSLLEYFSVLIYKKGLLYYLNGSYIMWIFFIFAASVLSINKAFYRFKRIKRLIPISR